MEPLQWFMLVVLAVILLAITRALLGNRDTDK
jgi:hypothetical protein